LAEQVPLNHARHLAYNVAIPNTLPILSGLNNASKGRCVTSGKTSLLAAITVRIEGPPEEGRK
jgi:hypothetical protein